MRWSSDVGATMVEYSLMVVLIAVLAVGVVQLLGLSVLQMFQSLVNLF